MRSALALLAVGGLVLPAPATPVDTNILDGLLNTNGGDSSNGFGAGLPSIDSLSDKDLDLNKVLPSEVDSPVNLANTLAGLRTSPVKERQSLPDSGSLLAEVESWLKLNTKNTSASALKRRGMTKTKRDPLGVSLPPLIPSIPGVTEPLTSNAPPLPVLQLPTPPLESDPFPVQADLRPKKIGYFWTGAGDNIHKDFLVTTSLDDDTFGTIIAITDVPTSGNSPHHLSPSVDGKTLVGGGLLSLLKTQDTAFYFDTTNPYKPSFKKSNRAILSSITDEIRAKPEGGFFITYMGSAVGTSPGRLVETDADGNILHEWPEDVDGTLNILQKQFSPHGLSIDWEKEIILTSDFVVPLSILKPTTGIQRADTLRLWDLKTRTIISTITIPNGGGIQDVKFIPGNKESAALATAVVPGEVWIIYPFRTNPDGTQGVAELLIGLGAKAQNALAIYSDISEDGKLAYFTLTLGNHVAAVDISDLSNPIRLDNPDENQPIIGPHYVKISPDKKNLLVTGYFVQAGDISIVNTPGDYKGHWIDILPNGGLSFNRTIDFENIFTKNRGGARPHSSVIFDLTDPANPIYY